MNRLWLLTAVLAAILALGHIACFDHDLGLGSSCEGRSGDCASGLSCIMHQPLPPIGGSCSGISYRCTRYCETNEGCASLGDDVVCSRTCGNSTVCARQ